MGPQPVSKEALAMKVELKTPMDPQARSRSRFNLEVLTGYHGTLDPQSGYPDSKNFA